MSHAKSGEPAAEPKKRSRTGCWPCKGRKIKCGEERPVCSNCIKHGETCDYSIRLNWEGRARRDHKESSSMGSATFLATPLTVSSANAAHEHVFSSQHIATPPPPPRTPITSSPAPRKALTSDPTSNIARHNESYPPLPDLHPEHTAKRVKLSPRAAVVESARLPDHLSPASTHLTPSSIDSAGTTPVATPGSSITSLSPYPLPVTLHAVPDPPDLRRLSVKSLLTDSGVKPERIPPYFRHQGHSHTTYGYDHGLPDDDLPRNDDAAVLQPQSPDLRRPSAAFSDISTSSADARDIAFESGGYYANPVPVKIPRFLEPLPKELSQSPVNLMYFHHFINHTARIMVPHDCPENPLRRVLPLMAIRNRQLLHLMLAFSASHRAKLLGHSVPANRIADWMADVLPALRQALDRQPHSPPQAKDPADLSTLAPLATAVMLASLEIMAPNTFEVPITWQNHLEIARQLIMANNGLQQMALQADGARDNAVFLISRWFAYLDVLGSLSGSKRQQPLDNAYMEDGGGIWLVNRNDDEVHRIDCFFGFSGTCIALLASVANLAFECEQQRIDPIARYERPGWRPSETIVRRANELRQRLETSAHWVSGACMHADGETDRIKTQQDRDEILATNQAFHWAGMLHLSRRVLALPRSHPEVQDGVRKVLAALSKVRHGSTAESCLLFPMFSAGCEALLSSERQVFLARLKSVEAWGMSHVARARKLMETVWETGESWDILVNGEFFG